MGKYMNKSKVTGDVKVIDVFSHPTGNGRTRAAKSLAFQKLQLKDANRKRPINLELEVSTRGTRESTGGSRNPYSPTAHEMEEFFASAEQQQQRSFIDKYNYDIVNDKPLDGRYEWVELVV